MRLCKVVRSIVFWLSILAVAAVYEAGEQTGTVTGIRKRSSDGLIYFYLSGTAASRASCATQTIYWMIKDENSNSGKQQLAMLMQARAAGQEIHVSGSGYCTRWSDGEDVDSIGL